MKRAIISFVFVLFGMTAVAASAFAQKAIDPAIDRDPVLEADAKHNLDVAWQAYRLKKAYKGVLMRFEETFAAYPDFSKMDEFLYLAGMSSHYLSENKGRQKINLKSDKEKEKFSPEKLHQDAVAYFAMLVEKFPQSQYKDEAESMLAQLKSADTAPAKDNN